MVNPFCYRFSVSRNGQIIKIKIKSVKYQGVMLDQELQDSRSCTDRGIFDNIRAESSV